jgi:hypothetical protein
MAKPSTLKAIRLTHRYLGIFIAPAVLFFAFTGFVQTFSLHETTRGSSYTPPAILVHLAQLHKKATLTTPTRKPAATPAPAPTPKPAPPTTAPPPATSFHWPMKIFFGIVAIGLFISTLTGLTMAWQYTRSKPTVATVFLAGIVLPLLLLLF